MRVISRFICVALCLFTTICSSGCFNNDQAAAANAAAAAAQAIRLATMVSFHDKNVQVTVGGDAGNISIDLNLNNKFVADDSNAVKYEIKIVDEHGNAIEGVSSELHTLTKLTPHVDIAFLPHKQVDCTAYILVKYGNGLWKQSSTLKLQAS